MTRPTCRARAALAATVLLLGGAAACGSDSTARSLAAAPPAAATADSRPTADAVVEVVGVDAPLSFPAQLHVERDVMVAARADGVLESLRVDLGSTVQDGAVLATVESEAQRLSAARAEATLDDAQRAVSRARALTGTGGVTAVELEAAELAVRRADLALAEARRELALTSVTAPFAGVVTARYVGPHRLVRAGDTLFRLTETGPLLARVRVPEAQAATLAVGAAAVVVALDGGKTPARVVRLAPAVDAASGTREVVLTVERAGTLRPGSAVTVRLGAARRQALVVPRAVLGDDGYVLVVEDGRAVLRAVTVGADVGDGRVEVLAGLAAGERVRRPER